jgi:hypothetical protein
MVLDELIQGKANPQQTTFDCCCGRRRSLAPRALLGGADEDTTPWHSEGTNQQIQEERHWMIRVGRSRIRLLPALRPRFE